MPAKFKISKILVPTDFSDLSIHALKYAGEFARKSGADVLLLHVVEAYELNTNLKGMAKYSEVLKDEIKEKLQRLLVDNKSLWGVKIDVLLEEGKIHKLISRVAEEQNCDLIVMGTHGASDKGALERFILGSNAYRTVHQSHADVITLRKITDEIKFDNVVIPLDVTKDTARKVEEAEKIARVFGSTLHVIAVSSFLDEFATSHAKLEKQLQAVVDQLKSKGLNVISKVLRHENVVDEINSYANSVNADLTVIMTRAESRIKELTLGSNARKIISESEVPVISFHPRN